MNFYFPQAAQQSVHRTAGTLRVLGTGSDYGSSPFRELVLLSRR
jgi:hypothetical protein